MGRCDHLGGKGDDVADEVGEINLLFGRGDIGPISVN